MSIPDVTNLIEHNNIDNMVEAWQRAMPKILSALRLIGNQMKYLNHVFATNDTYKEFRLRFNAGYASTSPKEPDSEEDLKWLEGVFHRGCWAVICDRLEIRKMMSSKRVDQLNDQLEGKGDPLPAITSENIIGIIQGFATALPEYMDEVCCEVYDYLRPHGCKLKTSQGNLHELGNKVILSYAVDTHGHGWQISPDTRQSLNNVANVFSLLDGYGPSQGHNGELVTAILGAHPGANAGETKYFRWRAWRNRNLHLTFKRMDLVDELLQRCASRRNLKRPDRPKSDNTDNALIKTDPILIRKDVADATQETETAPAGGSPAKADKEKT